MILNRNISFYDQEKKSKLCFFSFVYLLCVLFFEKKKQDEKRKTKRNVQSGEMMEQKGTRKMMVKTIEVAAGFDSFSHTIFIRTVRFDGPLVTDRIINRRREDFFFRLFLSIVIEIENENSHADELTVLHMANGLLCNFRHMVWVNVILIFNYKLYQCVYFMLRLFFSI